MKKKGMISIVVLMLLGLLACNGTNDEVQNSQQEMQETIFEATVLEIKDTYLLVEPVEGSAELNSADRITIPLANMSVSPEPEVGDVIEIKYNGEIAESYPAQITEVYSIKVVEETIEKDDNGAENELEATTEMQTEEVEITATEIVETEEPGTAVVSPLPTTIDLNDINDCTLAVSIENGDIYVSKADATRYIMKVKVYEYELFDLVDMSLLEVGSIIAIDKEQVEIVSLERNELGTVIINGGLETGGYELITDGNGVFYSIGYSDAKTYHELGEIELDISPEFIYIDASDLDEGEASYTLADLTANDTCVEYKGTPHDTMIVVENGVVTSMKKVYTP